MLIRQSAFRSVTAETVHILFPSVKNSVWEKTVSELLASVEIIEAPIDSSLRGQMDDEIEEFIQQFGQDESMDQIIAHTAYVSVTAKRAYFRAQDLLRRVKKNLGTEVSPQKLWAHMRVNDEYDIKSIEYTMKEVGKVKLWSISTRPLQLMTHGLTSPTVASQSIPF